MTGMPATLSVTGLSSSAGAPVWFPDPYALPPFSLSATCFNSSAQTYNLEWTNDYQGNFSSNFTGWLSSVANWFSSGGINGATSNSQVAIQFPVTAVRLNVTGGTSTGMVTAKLVQAG